MDASDIAKSPRAAFGVGCFYFSPSTAMPTDNRGSNYCELVKKGLERVSNINNIHLSDPIEPDPALRLHGDRWPSLDWEELRDFAAFPSWVTISFDVYIPARIQRELTSRSEKVGPELFRVAIHHSRMPVTVVQTVGSTESPSTGVIVVREYLERELAKVGELEFTSLGPSPFHAEFFLYDEQTDQSDSIVVKHEARRGYDKYDLTCPSKISANTSSPLTVLLAENLAAELSLFYEIRRLCVIEMLEWDDIEEILVSDLFATDLDSERSIRRDWTRIFRRGRQIERALTLLTKFEINRLRHRERIDELIRSVYASKDSSLFRHVIDQAREDVHDYPAQHVAQLLKFSEARRSRNLELSVAIVAALIGGAVGALVTMAVQAG